MPAHLFVIPGHGAGDPGAGGGGYNEAERVRALATKIKELGGDNVTLADFSRDYYKDNGITSLNMPKDWEILELHMDASSFEAKGGHVIINYTFEPDVYDKALAKFISECFPGRVETIVKRDNLANPRRAAAKGYSYRLLECCFITNANDLAKFNSQMTEVAKGILAAFNIGATVTPAAPEKSTVFDYISNTAIQRWIVEWDSKMEYCRLKNEKTGLYLGLYNSTNADATNVRAEPKSDAIGQWWKLEQVPGFNYQPEYLTPQRLVSKVNDKLALSPVNGTWSPGVGTKVYKTNASASQDLNVIDQGHNKWLIISNIAMLALEVKE